MTINCPESYLEAIEKIIGENGLYPSRSELIRVAVREFLIKELKRVKHMQKPGFKAVTNEKGETVLEKEEEDKNMIKIPIEHLDENDEPVREFRTYKILRRLDY